MERVLAVILIIFRIFQLQPTQAPEAVTEIRVGYEALALLGEDNPYYDELLRLSERSNTAENVPFYGTKLPPFALITSGGKSCTIGNAVTTEIGYDDTCDSASGGTRCVLYITDSACGTTKFYDNPDLRAELEAAAVGGLFSELSGKTTDGTVTYAAADGTDCNVFSDEYGSLCLSLSRPMAVNVGDTLRFTVPDCAENNSPVSLNQRLRTSGEAVTSVGEYLFERKCGNGALQYIACDFELLQLGDCGYMTEICDSAEDFVFLYDLLLGDIEARLVKKYDDGFFGENILILQCINAGEPRVTEAAFAAVNGKQQLYLRQTDEASESGQLVLVAVKVTDWNGNYPEVVLSAPVATDRR